MDVFAHVLWTNAGARGVNALSKKRKKKFHIHIGWTAFWGVIPDFFAFTIPFIVGFYQILFKNSSVANIRDHHGLIGGFDLAAYLYQFSHSIVIFALVFVLVWVICRKPQFVMFGWALHIIIDIFSHSIGFYPTPFLFPISEFRYPYGVSWAHPTFMTINYILLGVTWTIILVEKRINKRLKKAESVSSE